MKALGMMGAWMLITANAHGFTDWAGWLVDSARVWEMDGDGNADGTGDATALVGGNGTWTGSAAYADPPSGWPGKAFVTSNGNYLSIANLGQTGTAATFVCWVYPTSTPPSWAGILMTRTADACGIHVNDSSRVTAMWRGLGWDFAGPTISNTTWQHYAVVFDSAPTPDQIRFYKDGALVATNTAVAVASATYASDIKMGVDSNFPSARYFVGRIYRPAIANRALTAGEVAVLYNGPPTSAAGLHYLQPIAVP